MSAPALARNRTGRRYLIPDPPPDGPPIEMPSVTTILNNLAKPALVNWAALRVAEYAYRERDIWHQLDEKAAIDLLKRSPYRETRQKADIGTAVHSAVEAFINTGTAAEPPTIHDIDLLPWVGGALRFLNDYVARVIRTEATFVNFNYRYAGTGDLIFVMKPANDLTKIGVDEATAKRLSSQVCLGDWKSGRRVYPETALQLSAYGACRYVVNDDGTRWTPPPITTAVAIHLDGNSGYSAQPVELTDRLFKTFVALRTIQHYRDTLEAEVLGDPLAVQDVTDDYNERLRKIFGAEAVAN